MLGWSIDTKMFRSVQSRRCIRTWGLMVVVVAAVVAVVAAAAVGLGQLVMRRETSGRKHAALPLTPASFSTALETTFSAKCWTVGGC